MASAIHKQRAVPSNEEQGACSPSSWLVLLLALSIFAWGTSYKLSLFKRHQPGSVPPAKLCKLTSDNAKSQFEHAVLGNKVEASSPTANTVSTIADSGFLLYEEVALSSGTASLGPLRSAPILHLRPPPVPRQLLFL